MKYLSLFSGIEAATQAWKPLGWEAVAYSEIEKFPCAVLEHYYPDTPNLGDITKITESQIKKLGQIDLVVFGSPCQDLSVAGKRKGLSSERSGLFTTAIKVIKWARKHGGARFALWENVLGAFSSSGGKDFAEVIRLLSGAKLTGEKWSTAGVAIGKDSLLEWRVLDAQHFGVPQRRRRIFALADFGEWADRQPILFESEGVPRDIKASREEGKGFAKVAGTLAASGGGLNRPAGNANELDFCIPSAMATLNASDADKWGSNQWVNEGKCLTIPETFATQGSMIGRSDKADPQGSGFNKNTQFTLNTTDRHAVAFNTNARPDELNISEVNQGLTCSQNAATLTQMQVRRLTPIECERLQGFPDNFTKIPYRNKIADDCPDSPRYKALGNSMAVPVMRWIGLRVAAAHDS